MALSIYDNIIDLPVDETVEVGDVAFVKENYKFYNFLDLSLEKTYSYTFGGVSSYLKTTDVLVDFIDSSDEFTIDFWTYITENNSYPVFSVEALDYSYTLEDQIGNNLSTYGTVKSLFFSPYDSDLTSEYFYTNYIDVDSIQSSLPDINNPFQIEYWTRATNTAFTVFSSNKTDVNESILQLNNNNIIVNGSTLSGNISYPINEWQFNQLRYDGFDYRFFQDSNEIALTPNYQQIDSAQNLYISSIPVDKNRAFECKVTIPSNPTNGVLFDLGGEINRTLVQIEDNGNTFSIEAGDVSANLKASTSDFPKDDQEHIISWDIQINPGRIRLWIDGQLKISKTIATEIPDAIWANNDRLNSIIEIPNTTSFQSYGCSPYLLGSGKWRVDRFSSISHFLPNTPAITKNGNDLYYFEISIDEVYRFNRLYVGIVKPNTDFRWFARAYANYWNSSWARLYPYRGYRFGFLIDESRNYMYIFFNGYLYSTMSYSQINVSSLKIIFESYYCDINMTAYYHKEDWVYTPYTLARYINTGPEGSYGAKLGNDGVRSLVWPGELVSNLRIYPQTFGSLNDGSFTVGNRRYQSTNSNSNYYSGYLKDFNVTTYDPSHYNQIIDSDSNGFIYSDSINIPTISKQVDSDTKFLLTSNVNGGVILGYRTDGTIIKNGNTIQTADSNLENIWEHNAITYNGSLLRSYKNGQLTFEDSINFKGYSLSDGRLDIGRISVLDYNTASYVSSYYKDNISNFRIRREVIGDSIGFPVPTNQYIENDSDIILTCNASVVENDGVIQNINYVDAVEQSPFSTSTRNWFETGIVSNNIQDIILNDIVPDNQHINYVYDSYYNPNFDAISVLIELQNFDDNGDSIVWTPNIISNPYSSISVKQNRNRFLIEPIPYQDSSYLERFEFIYFDGLLKNNSVPFINSPEENKLYDAIKLGFAYTNENVSLEQNNTIFVSDFYTLIEKDSSIDSEFQNILPIVAEEFSIQLQIFDSIGELS